MTISRDVLIILRPENYGSLSEFLGIPVWWRLVVVGSLEGQQ